MILRSSVIFLLTFTNISGFQKAFDHDLYQNVIDPEQCQQQLIYLLNNTLGLRFLDSSGKIPSGLLSGNLVDLGDYYQCLAIDENVNEMAIKGKYCAITLPVNQNPINLPDQLPILPNITFPELPEIPFPNITWPPNNEVRQELEELIKMQHWAQMMAGVSQPVNVGQNNPNARIFPVAVTARAGAVLGICVPKVCNPRQAMDFFLDIVPYVNLTYNEYFCRLPNDRPFAPVDYVAISFFSVIAALVITSTCYDLYNKFILETESSGLLRSFSVYTNTRRFLTFNKIPGALECLDGIRAISMMWVVVGHTYSMTLLGFVHNIRYALAWLRLFSSTWVNSAPLTVDTFFLLSGILAVYATVGKISRGRFIRTVHLFYINRLLRMFPLLATVILLQASIFNYVSDGPFWQNVAHAAENCRQYWWSALLHVQNYVNPLEICLAHTWYLSVDTQLYIVCPLILVWMFGNARIAGLVVSLAVVLSLVSASVYSFIYDFSAALVQPNRITEFGDYVQIYYINTLCRAPPFFIGMIYGYMLHLYRGRKIRIPKLSVAVLWILAFAMMSFCVFSIYPVMQLDHQGQTFDNFLNAYMRSMWAAGLGWLIFACVQGYGGPINWFLSLQMWKLPARLSYAMYLIHLPIIMIANSTWTKSHYFTNGDNLYRFMSDLLLTFIAAFVLCVLIDAPFSTLQKTLLGGGKKRPPREKTESQLDIVEREKSRL